MSQRIVELVRRSQRRFVFNRLSAGLVEFVGFACLFTIGFVTWGRWADVGVVGYSLYAGLLACGCGCYLYHKLRKGTSLVAVAILLDREFGLRDRISSSLEFARCPTPSSCMKAHMKETAQFLERQEPFVLRLVWPEQMKLLILLGLVVCLSLPPRSLPFTGDVRQVGVKPKSAKVIAVPAAAKAPLKRKDLLSSLSRQDNMITQVEKAVLASLDLLTPEDLGRDQNKEDHRPTPSKESAMDQSELRKLVGAADAFEKTALAREAHYQPEGKFDSFPKQAYTKAFAEIDTKVLASSMTVHEVKNLSAHMQGVADTFANFGFFDADKAMGTEGAARQPQFQGVDPGEHNSFMRHLGSLHHKAFSEFLKRYAAHLGQEARSLSRVERAQRQNSRSQDNILALSTPPPKNAKLHLHPISEGTNRTRQARGAANPNQTSPAPAQAGGPNQVAQKSPHQTNGMGTQTGGRGAGVGASDSGTRPPALLPRAEGGEYLPLEGKLSDGQSIVQLIDARSHDGPVGLRETTSAGVTFQQVYRFYAKGAQAELNSERVPFQMRDYVRAYFRSIRPGEGREP